MIQTEHNAILQNLGNLYLPDQAIGNSRLNVMPFINSQHIVLPEGFRQWENALQEVMRHVPLQEGANTHYVTLNSEFFTTDMPLRREGIHMDGNFCVDPEFSYNGGRGVIGSWAYQRPTWSGMVSGRGHYREMPDNSHVEMDWVLPYDIVIPIATYVSNTKGGILTVSSKTGCQAWEGCYYGNVGDGGSWAEMEAQLTDGNKTVLAANKLYFMNSVTPHETLEIPKGARRTFLRVTLNHDYDNWRITGGGDARCPLAH